MKDRDASRGGAGENPDACCCPRFCLKTSSPAPWCRCRHGLHRFPGPASRRRARRYLRDGSFVRV